MALENVKEDIIRTAEAKVSEILAGSDADIAKIKAETEAVIADMKKKEDKRLKETTDRLSRQEASSAELESKKIVLEKKREILEQAFDETLAELESASPKVKKEQYKRMVTAAKKVIKEPKAFCAKGETLSAEDLGVSSLTKLDSISGGLIFESKDGLIRVDMQFKTMLQTVWDRESKSISDILFG